MCVFEFKNAGIVLCTKHVPNPVLSLLQHYLDYLSVLEVRNRESAICAFLESNTKVYYFSPKMARIRYYHYCSITKLSECIGSVD